MKLLSDAVFMACARVIVIASAAATNVVIARLLGPIGRGAYALPSIDASLATTFALGLSSAVSYFLLNRKAGTAIVAPALGAAALVTAAGAIFVVAVATWNHQLWAVWPALVYLPAYALMSLVSGYWIGRGRVRSWSMVAVATGVVTLAFVCAGLFFVGKAASIAVGGWVAGTVVVSVVGAVLVALDLRRLGAGQERPAGFFRFTGKTGLLNVMTLLNYRVDVYIVAALAPLSTLGLYAIAVAGAESALALTHTASMVTAPRIGTLERDEAGAFTARCSRSSVFVATLACIAIGLLAPWIVRVLLGAAFVPLVPTLRVLLVGVVALSVGGVICNYFMLNLGRVRIPLWSAAASAVVCAGLSFALVPRIGMLGAALGTTVAYIVGQVVAVASFCRETGLHPARVLVIDRSDLALYRTVFVRLVARWT